MKYLHALLACDRENLQENPRALLLLTCKLAEHMLQTIILNTAPVPEDWNWKINQNN